MEVESDKITVKDLKKEIEKVHGFDSETLKLLHNGVVLDDSKTLESYQIKDQNVMIVMNTRIKTKEHDLPPQNAPQENDQDKDPEFIKKVETIKEMGYEEKKIKKALVLAKGDVNKAIELLAAAKEALETENAINSLPDELKKNASIIKIICSRDPSKINSILENMKNHNAALLEKIKQNEAGFKAALVSPITPEDLVLFREFQQELRQMGEGGRRPGQVEIRLTKEEGEAVKRLKEITNCSQAEVIQAYIACDKNEELTANYLFEQKMKDGNSNDNNNQGQGP